MEKAVSMAVSAFFFLDARTGQSVTNRSVRAPYPSHLSCFVSGFAVKAGGDTRVSSDEAQRLGRDLAPPVRDGENGSPVE